jgi:hypothetical protein
MPKELAPGDQRAAELIPTRPGRRSCNLWSRSDTQSEAPRVCGCVNLRHSCSVDSPADPAGIRHGRLWWSLTVVLLRIPLGRLRAARRHAPGSQRLAGNPEPHPQGLQETVKDKASHALSTGLCGCVVQARASFVPETNRHVLSSIARLRLRSG